MQYSHEVLFLDEAYSDDEIDDLFGQLEAIEPPTSLVEDILNRVEQLPFSQSKLFMPASCGELVVHSQFREPS